MLTVTISDGEEVAVLEATEMWHCDPHVLVNLIWVARGQASLGRESKLCHGIRVHLLRIARVVREGLQVRRIDRLAALLSCTFPRRRL